MIVSIGAGLLASAQISQGKSEAPGTGDGGALAVITANSSQQPPTSANPRVDEDDIFNILVNKLDGQGWDSSKKRLSGVEVYEFHVNPNVSMDEYCGLRQIAAMGAMLKAQAKIANWFGTKAEMEVALDNPGNPFFGEDVNIKAKQEIKERLDKLKSELAATGVKLNDGIEVTSADRFKIAADALLKKLDKDYDPTKSAAQKAAKVDAVKQQAEELQGQINALEKKYKDYQNAYTKALSSGVEMKYDHVIFGLSAVYWAENYKPNGDLIIGLAWVWSPKLCQAAYGALVGDKSLDNNEAKGSESVQSWVRKQDLSSIGAFRYFLDDKGDRWFIGVGTAPNSLDDADTYAVMNSIQNLYMPLYSKLTGKRVVKERARAGRTEADMPAVYTRDLIESLKANSKADTRGISEIFARNLKWPAKVAGGGTSDASVRVSVHALSANSAGAALAGEVQAALAAAAVEHENNRRQLEHAHLLGIVEKAKLEIPAPRAQGVVNKVENQNTKKTGNQATRQDQAPTNQKLSPEPGVRVTPGKAKDDF